MSSRFCTFVLSFAIAFHPMAFAQAPAPAAGEQEYVSFWNIFTKIPATAGDGLSRQWDRDALPGWAAMLGSTAILHHYDEDLSSDIRSKGRAWGWGNQEHTKTMLKIGNTAIFRGPTDTASWLYFMGDGIVPISVATGFTLTGHWGKHPRAWNTGIVMANGLLTATIFSQGLKRIFGRESPSQASSPRGTWRPFPNPKAYSKSTARYDAMPSGHIMTATLMFTVLREEYPEHNYWLLPFEVVWLTALGVGMINNDTHWASDYPLGIALGYVFGRAAVRMHKPAKGDKDATTSASWMFMPGLHAETDTPTVNAVYSF